MMKPLKPKRDESLHSSPQINLLMKTPMQELLEWVRATLPMDLETPQMIERKIESMLEKEKEVMQDFATEYERECRVNLERSIEKCWDETFNTKER